MKIFWRDPYKDSVDFLVSTVSVVASVGCWFIVDDDHRPEEYIRKLSALFQ